jgi:hypothetical protein
MTISRTVFTEFPPQPYAVARDRVRDGDILLCSARDPGSRLIRWATRSPWSHVAIAFRVDEVKRVLVLECVQSIGVRAVPLSDFISRTSSGTRPYPGRILLARHADLPVHADHAVKRAMSRFAFGRLGDKFSNLETAKIGLRIAFGRLGRVMPRRLEPDDEYICSEYVAKCFEHVGVPITWDGRGFIAPADIAADPRVVAVAQIDTRPATVAAVARAA